MVRFFAGWHPGQTEPGPGSCRAPLYRGAGIPSRDMGPPCARVGALSRNRELAPHCSPGRRVRRMGTQMVFNRVVIALITPLSIWPSLGISQVERQEARIESTDGFILAGRYYSTGARGPGLMLLHQCNREGPLTGYENLAVLLAERGFNVLELDFRGFGNSRNAQYPEFRGQMRATASKFPADVEAAYQYLIAHSAVDEQAIGVVGASCGASQAMFLAQNHESIKTLVVLSGSLWPGAREAYDDLTRLPILIATSEEDRVTEGMMELFSASEAPNSRLLLYKGDVHGTPLFDLDGSLRLSIVEWFSETLDESVEDEP